MTIRLTAFVVSVLTVLANLQGKGGPLSPLGVWRGTSTCLVHPSACKDEIVVYYVTPTNVRDSVSIDARKIVNGVEEGMGSIGCRFAERTALLTCAMPNGVWRFVVSADSLAGELRIPDGRRFRIVRTARSR